MKVGLHNISLTQCIAPTDCNGKTETSETVINEANVRYEALNSLVME